MRLKLKLKMKYNHLLIIGHSPVPPQLWSHVLLCAFVSPQTGWGGELGDAVVSQSDIDTVLWVQRPDQDVSWLDVAVDDVEGVEVADAISNLRRRGGRGEEGGKRGGGGGGGGRGEKRRGRRRRREEREEEEEEGGRRRREEGGRWERKGGWGE